MPDLREWYLVEVEGRLRGRIPAQDLNTIIRELESHLYEAHDHAKSQGMSEDQAQLAAIESLGSPVSLARNEYRRHKPLLRLAKSLVPWLASTTGFAVIFITLSPYYLALSAKLLYEGIVYAGVVALGLWTLSSFLSGRFGTKAFIAGVLMSILVQVGIGSQSYLVPSVSLNQINDQLTLQYNNLYVGEYIPTHMATQAVAQLNDVYTSATQKEAIARTNYWHHKTSWASTRQELFPNESDWINPKSITSNEIQDRLITNHTGPLTQADISAYAHTAVQVNHQLQDLRDAQVNYTSAIFLRETAGKDLQELQKELSTPALARAIRSLAPPFSISLILFMILPLVATVLGGMLTPVKRVTTLAK